MPDFALPSHALSLSLAADERCLTVTELSARRSFVEDRDFTEINNIGLPVRDRGSRLSEAPCVIDGVLRETGWAQSLSLHANIRQLEF